jgi:hypothetical protein
LIFDLLILICAEGSGSLVFCHQPQRASAKCNELPEKAHSPLDPVNDQELEALELSVLGHLCCLSCDHDWLIEAG